MSKVKMNGSNIMVDDVSDKLNYRPIPYAHPSYRLHRILKQSGGQTETITNAGGQESIFEIPVNVVNLSRSFLCFTISIPVANFNRVHSAAFAPVRHIQLYTRGGLFLCDVPYLPQYTNVVWKPETKLEDFLTYDTHTAAGNTGNGRLFRRSNSTVDNADVSQRPNNTPASLHYTEASYFLKSVQDIAVDMDVKIPLSSVKNTILELDKDLYFGEVLILRIVWEQRDKIYWRNANANDPTAGPPTAPDNVSISELALILSVEKNQAIINQLREQTLSGNGMSVLTKYVYCFKTNLGGSSQSVSLRLNRGHGLKLQKIYHSVFSNDETLHNTFNHFATGKILDYYTLLNNERIQEFNLSPGNETSYMYLLHLLKGSVIQNSNIFSYNWFHVDCFTEELAPDDSANNKLKQNQDQGIDLTTEQKWDIFLTMATNNIFYNHYSFAIVERMVNIGPSGITLL